MVHAIERLSKVQKHGTQRFAPHMVSEDQLSCTPFHKSHAANQ